jgi:predicted GNAT family N-acyltransferase
MSGFGFSNGSGAGTEFLSMQPPPQEAVKDYDNTKPHTQQKISIPQVFGDAMSVREEVFGEQGVPLEAEFDEDDRRSWHWVVYASVAVTSNGKTDDERRASASAGRLAVGTIRLVPPPHGPNKYIKTAELKEGDKHPDADPPPYISDEVQKKHPTEPYIKLGRLAILKEYRSLGLSKLLINTALEWASKHPDSIRPPPSPTTMEAANQLGHAIEKAVVWNGLAMIHAQVSVEKMWAKHGFTEELRNEKGEIEVSKEGRWDEEGIQHMGMWKRLKVDNRRL